MDQFVDIPSLVFGCRHCVCLDEAELFWYIENIELLKVPNLKSGSIFFWIKKKKKNEGQENVYVFIWEKGEKLIEIAVL